MAKNKSKVVNDALNLYRGAKRREAVAAARKLGRLNAMAERASKETGPNPGADAGKEVEAKAKVAKDLRKKADATAESALKEGENGKDK